VQSRPPLAVELEHRTAIGSLEMGGPVAELLQRAMEKAPLPQAVEPDHLTVTELRAPG
jgi:hypothetical protein